MAFGSARVEAREQGRRVYGVTLNVPQVWDMPVGQNSCWPAGDPRRGRSMAVLGPTPKRELVGIADALGERVEIGGGRFWGVGVM